MSESAHAIGHRRRMIEAFNAADGRGFHDYQRLELLLFYAIPRRDVKPLAKELLARFGSLRGVFTAEEAELLAVPGVGPSTATLFRLIRTILVSCLEENLREKPHPSHKIVVEDYLRVNYGASRNEELVILLLDRHDRMIGELRYPGGADSTQCDRRDVLRKILLRRQTASVIAAHNHPDGNVCPSIRDINATRSLCALLNSVGIRLKDSLVVTADRCVSLMKYVPRR